MLTKRLFNNAPNGFEFLQAANSGSTTASNDEHVIEVREQPKYVGTPAAPFKHYPLMYFCRGKLSDRNFIMQRMRLIPEKLKHHASEQYERIYSQHGRKAANIWLDAVARNYRGIVSFIIGIAPDATKPSFALTQGQKIIELCSMIQPELIERIVRLAALHQITVKIEDVEATKPTFIRPDVSVAGMMKITQKVEQVKQASRDITEQLKSKGITPVMVKPLRGSVKRAAKKNGVYFNKLTGWTGCSNQDTRDATMIALWGKPEVKSWRN